MICDSLRVLLAENNTGCRRALASVLEAEGHGVDVAGDGNTAVRLAAGTAHDVVVLDSSLDPDGGASLCHAIRKLRPAVPVLMMVASAPEVERLREPGCGVDGWVEKPFPPREILGLIRGLRSRALVSMITPEALQADGVRLDLARARVFRNGHFGALTAREVGILRWLYNHRTRAVSRAELLEEVWGVPGDLQTRTVDMTISNLRRKIEQRAATPRIIVTVKGCGYVWGAAD